MPSISAIIKNNKFVLITVILLLLNFTSSLTVIYVRHINRIMMSDLQKLVDKQERIYEEWTQLLLEQSTLTSYNRVDNLARSKLKMRLPEKNEIFIMELK